MLQGRESARRKRAGRPLGGPGAGPDLQDSHDGLALAGGNFRGGRGHRKVPVVQRPCWRSQLPTQQVHLPGRAGRLRGRESPRPSREGGLCGDPEQGERGRVLQVRGGARDPPWEPRGGHEGFARGAASLQEAGYSELRSGYAQHDRLVKPRPRREGGLEQPHVSRVEQAAQGWRAAGPEALLRGHEGGQGGLRHRQEAGQHRPAQGPVGQRADQPRAGTGRARQDRGGLAERPGGPPGQQECRRAGGRMQLAPADRAAPRVGGQRGRGQVVPEAGPEHGSEPPRRGD
mmetsp:Transcript_43970/g.130199  ORF Transcript_43970/g.130199 Transcript_43970/m.130199 type:complete len:288 (+) Transcript_43970:310-1173(+)